MNQPQRINLYQPAFHPRRGWLTLSGVTLMVGALLLTLAGISVAMQHRFTLRQQEVEQKVHQEEAVMMRLSALARSRPNPGQEQADDDARGSVRAFLELLEETRRNHSAGFSAALAGMGEAKLSGVWLTAITLNKGGAEMTIQGVTRGAELIPEYVRGLLSRPVFVERQFDSIQVRDKGSEELRAFQLYSSGRKEKGAAKMATPTGGFL